MPYTMSVGHFYLRTIMNIHYPTNDYKAIPNFLCDVLLNCMIKESVQLLHASIMNKDNYDEKKFTPKSYKRIGKKSTATIYKLHYAHSNNKPSYYACLMIINHIGHPSQTWTESSYANFEWLYNYTCALHAEYKKRRGHDDTWVHGAFKRLLDFPVLERAKTVLSDKPFTAPPNVTPYPELPVN